MARPKYLRIPPEKWKRYQQKRRPDGWRPRWLKLWNSLLDDYQLRVLPAETRYVYVGLLVAANENENRIKLDYNSLGNRLTISPKRVQNSVETLVANGLVERVYSANCENGSKSVRNDRSREDRG